MSMTYCPKCGRKGLQKRTGDNRFRCGTCATRFQVLFDGFIEPPEKEDFRSPIYGESDTLENFDLSTGKGKKKGGAI